MDTVHRYAGCPEKGIPLLYQAIELIDADQNPRLELCARHNLIDDLADAPTCLFSLEPNGVLYRVSRNLAEAQRDVVTLCCELSPGGTINDPSAEARAASLE